MINTDFVVDEADYIEDDNLKPCRNMRCKYNEKDFCMMRERGEDCLNEV